MEQCGGGGGAGGKQAAGGEEVRMRPGVLVLYGDTGHGWEIKKETKVTQFVVRTHYSGRLDETRKDKRDIKKQCG